MRKKNLVNCNREATRNYEVSRQAPGTANPPRTRAHGTIPPNFAGLYTKPGAARQAMPKN